MQASDRGRRCRRWERGFARSELVLVVVVVVVLVAVAVMSVRAIRDDTLASDCQTQLRVLKLATKQYQSERGTYPAEQALLVEEGYLEPGEVTMWEVRFAAADPLPSYVPADSVCG